MSDTLQRFVFDQQDARGAIVQLEETCEAIQSTHHYPPALAKLLNQFAVAVCLLRDSIKIEANVTIQLRSKGAISLIMADSLADKRIRAIAEYDANRLPSTDAIELNALPEGSVLAITISPEKGERYQGVVPIENGSLEACLQDYFARSEQLPSLFKLMASQERATGIAIHALPTEDEQSNSDVNGLGVLLSTLEEDEALDLEGEEVLRRLFANEQCRVFPSEAIEFGCQCSYQKSVDAVASLGLGEMKRLVEEQKQEGNEYMMTECHFCFQRYQIPLTEIQQLIIEAS